ncbi:MAG: hypothetical protein Q6K59_02980, partial [Gloeomargarita sp. GMQP_bins_25]
PELVGAIAPEMVGQMISEYLQHPEQLDHIRQELRQVRGPTGADRAIAQMIKQLLTNGKIDQVHA